MNNNTIIDYINEISGIKSDIYDEITGKGGIITGGFDSYAAAIENLKLGTAITRRHNCNCK
jgi:hypothetical protein